MPDFEVSAFMFDPCLFVRIIIRHNLRREPGVRKNRSMGDDDDHHGNAWRNGIGCSHGFPGNYRNYCRTKFAEFIINMKLL